MTNGDYSCYLLGVMEHEMKVPPKYPRGGKLLLRGPLEVPHHSNTDGKMLNKIIEPF